MRLIIVAVFVFMSGHLWSQKVILYELRVSCHTLMENYIRFYAKGADEKSLVFTTDTGNVTQYRDMLIFKTNKPGMAKFKVYRKKRGRLTLYDSIEVMVHENKYAEARVGTKSGGVIDKKILIALGALFTSVWTREDHSNPVGVEGYTVIFHKSDGSVLVQKNTENRFNEPTIQIMKDLQSGERVTFTNIRFGKYGRPDLEAKPIEFTIK